MIKNKNLIKNEHSSLDNKFLLNLMNNTHADRKSIVRTSDSGKC